MNFDDCDVMTMPRLRSIRSRQRHHMRRPIIVHTQEESSAATLDGAALVTDSDALQPAAQLSLSLSGAFAASQASAAPSVPPLLPPPPPAQTPQDQRSRFALLARLQEVMVARARDAAGVAAVPAAVRDVRRWHWARLPQVARVVRELLGPLRGEAYPPRIDHRARLTRYLVCDCAPAGYGDGDGGEGGVVLQATVRNILQRHYGGGGGGGDAGGDPLHRLVSVAGEEVARGAEGVGAWNRLSLEGWGERFFLRLLATVGVAESAADPDAAFGVDAAGTLRDAYLRSEGGLCLDAVAEKLGCVAKHVALARRHGAERQLERAVLEVHRPHLLPPGPRAAARLKAFCRRHGLPLGQAARVEAPMLFEEHMLNLVVEHGAESRDILEYEMAEPPHVSFRNAPTPLM